MIRLTDYSFVSAAEYLPDIAYSFAEEWKAPIYAPAEFANSLARVNWLEITNPNNEWEGWRASWRNDDQFITIGMLSCPLEPSNPIRPGLHEYWGGSTIDARCQLPRFLDLWNSIRKTCPAVCIHDSNCRLFTPAQFGDLMTSTNQ